MSELSVQNHSSQYYEQRYTGSGLRYHTEVIQWLMGHAQSKVLDAGCGTGIVSSLYAKTSLDILGVDISDGMLATKRYLDRIHLRLG